jgi:hypothetical protein
MADPVVVQQQVPVPRPSSNLSKINAAIGALLGLYLFVQPYLPALGVPKENLAKIDVVAQKLQDLHDKIDARDKQDQQQNPVLVPAVSPEVKALQDANKALQDQIKNLTDAMLKLSQPKEPPAQLPDKPVTVVPGVVPALTATDAHGKSITDSIDGGRQFTVHASQLGAWTVIPPKSDDIDTSEYGNDLVCTLRNGAVLTVVHSVGASPKPMTISMIIKCLTGAQPPPVVVVDPNQPPPQVVPPGSKKFDLYIVENGVNKRDVPTMSIINQLGIRKQLTDKGHGIFMTTDQAADGVYANVKSKNVPLPALAIYDKSTKQFLQAVPLPTDVGLSLVTSLGG